MLILGGLFFIGFLVATIIAGLSYSCGACYGSHSNSYATCWISVQRDKSEGSADGGGFSCLTVYFLPHTSQNGTALTGYQMTLSASIFGFFLFLIPTTSPIEKDSTDLAPLSYLRNNCACISLPLATVIVSRRIPT